ncbi:pyruvate formate lyase family protein, partial [Escherichia coli]|uniref:pyruvate formate lyase family protein n=1 Tax=Escherichia coli TaxID=562 RepID=UPI003D34A1F3
QEAVQWLYFAYLAAVKSQNGGAMSLGRTASFLDIYIERDVLNCRVIIARSLSELVAIREEIEPLLIINNSHYLL